MTVGSSQFLDRETLETKADHKQKQQIKKTKNTRHEYDK